MSAPATSPRRKRRLGLKLLLALLTPVVTIAGLEAGSYLFGTVPGPVQPVRDFHLSRIARYDRELFWSLVPGATNVAGRREINDQGLRGLPLRPKPPGAIRILSLGESTTYGWGVEALSTYSAVLERELCAAGTTVQVLNAGVPGYSLWQGVQFLLRRSEAFAPDVVLLYFGHNDFLRVSYLGERAAPGTAHAGLSDRELFELRETPTQRAAWWLSQHSNLCRWILQPSGQKKAPAQVATDKPRVSAQDRRLALSLAQQHCADHSQTLVVLIPIYREFTTHEQPLRAVCEELGIATVDLAAEIPPRMTVPRERHFVDPLHPSELGHRRIGELLAEKLPAHLR